MKTLLHTARQTIALIGILAVLGSAAVSQEAKKYAVLFGVSRYESSAMNQPLPLEFPEADAKALGKVLSDSGYKCVVVLGRDATRDRIRSELAKLKSEGNDAGAVVVGFFGHGVEYDVPGKTSATESYFCPYDVDLRFAKDKQGRTLFADDGKSKLTEPDPEKAVGMTEVFDALRLSKAGRRILIADCCRNDPNVARGRSFGANVNVSDLPERTAALFACSRGERAFEDSENGHGAFTHSLLERIKNHAGPALTAASLAEHLEDAVAQRVKKITNGKQSQTPRYLSHSKVDLLLKVNKEQAKTEDDSYRPEDSYFAPSLYPGMKAPALGRLEFIEGEPVEEFKPGTVYVLNAFASWCGPCLQMIPKLASLQQKFPEVVFIEVDISGVEDIKDFLKTEKFVDKYFSADRKIGYRFAAMSAKATAGQSSFEENWMSASGNNFFPLAFVVDKRTRLAWVGHPNDLDEKSILKQLQEGKLNISEIKEQFLESKIQARLEADVNTLDSETKVLSTLEVCHPDHEAHKFAFKVLEKEWSILMNANSDWEKQKGNHNSLMWSLTTRNRFKSLLETYLERNKNDFVASQQYFIAMAKETLFGNKEQAKAAFEKWSDQIKLEWSEESDEDKEKALKELDRIQKQIFKFLDLR